MTEIVPLRQSNRRFLSFGSFTMNEKGLTVEVPSKKKGEGTRFLWLSAPFEILGRVRDPDGKGWARMLRWHDDDGREHTQSISDAELHGDPKTLCAIVASRGLKVATGYCRSHLLCYLNEARAERRVTVVSRTGWHKIGAANVFVLPDETVGAAVGETVIVERRSRAVRKAGLTR